MPRHLFAFYKDTKSRGIAPLNLKEGFLKTKNAEKENI